MNIRESHLICHKSVVGKIFGGGQPKRQVVNNQPDPNIAKHQAEQDAREKDLKTQERARKASIAASQRGSRLLLFDSEKGVRRKLGTAGATT